MAPTQQAVLILQGFSAYDNFLTFYDMVARSIRKRGFDPVFLNIRDANDFNRGMTDAIQKYTLENILAALTLNGLGLELGDSSPEGNLWGRLKIPILSWMGDHPAYYLSRHQHKSPAIALMYEYKDYLDFHRHHVQSQGRLTYAPFGVWDFGKPVQPRTPSRHESPLIILPKTGGDPQELQKAWASLPHKLETIILNAIDHYWSETPRSGSVSPSVRIAAEQAHLYLDNDLKLFSFLIVQVDDYIRRRKVRTMVEALLPFPVKIYGSGLDYMNTENARAIISPALDYPAMVELYHEALAIINVNPNVDDECHDRVYSAFGCGALPISDINPWWEKNYPDLMPYSFDFRDRPLTAAVEKGMADPRAMAEIAWNQRTVALQKRSFDDTVAEALDFAIMHRYYAFNFVPPQAYYSKGIE